MIIPTAEYDPLFAQDGVPFQTKMIAYILREFSDTLGERASLLRGDDGLETVAAMYLPDATETPRHRRVA